MCSCFKILVLLLVSWDNVTTTTAPPTTSAAAQPTIGTRSPYLTVNNITYVTLQNPCVLRQAMCPVFCEMSNVSYKGRICENCYCPPQISKALGEVFILLFMFVLF